MINVKNAKVFERIKMRKPCSYQLQITFPIMLSRPYVCLVRFEEQVHNYMGIKQLIKGDRHVIRKSYLIDSLLTGSSMHVLDVLFLYLASLSSLGCVKENARNVAFVTHCLFSAFILMHICLPFQCEVRLKIMLMVDSYYNIFNLLQNNH